MDQRRRRRRQRAIAHRDNRAHRHRKRHHQAERGEDHRQHFTRSREALERIRRRRSPPQARTHARNSRIAKSPNSIVLLSSLLACEPIEFEPDLHSIVLSANNVLNTLFDDRNDDDRGVQDRYDAMCERRPLRASARSYPA